VLSEPEGQGVAYLERLRIPVLHLVDRGHLIEAVRELVQLLYAVCQSYRQFLGKEL
jgi:hypothetical protein